MSPSGRPRSFDRDKALETVMRLFWQKGFESTSKRDIMEATGLASQSLYNTFGDKHDLFMEAVRHYAESHLRQIEEPLKAEGSPLENLERVVQIWADPPPGFEEGCLLCNSLAEFGSEDNEVALFLKKKMGDAQRLFEECLERALQHGELAPGSDIKGIASQLMCTGIGASILRRADAPQAMLEDTVRSTVAFLRGLRT